VLYVHINDQNIVVDKTSTGGAEVVQPNMIRITSEQYAQDLLGCLYDCKSGSFVEIAQEQQDLGDEQAVANPLQELEDRIVKRILEGLSN